MALILALSAFALVLARALGAPPGTWRYVAAGAAAAAVASQLLPSGHPLRVDLVAVAQAGFWLGLAAIPVGAYALWVRGLRRRAGTDAPGADAARPVGLVQFAEDAALAAETATALAAEAPGARLSIGWRGESGALEGHLRLRVAGDLAEIELLHVAEDARGRGVGGALVRAAEGEAVALGARRIGAAVAPWQSPAFFARARYEAGDGSGPRRWMEKRLA